MISAEQVLALLGGDVDRPTLEAYVRHSWVRPLATGDGFAFEEIDVARIRLVRHLQHDLTVNDEGMDVVLALLDQLYEMRRHYGLFSRDEEAISPAEFWDSQEEF